MKPSAHVDKENTSGAGKKPSTPGRKPPASPSRNPDLVVTTGPLVVDEIDALPAAQLSAAPLPDVAAAPSDFSSSGFLEAEVQTAIDLNVDERSVATLQEKLWEMTTLYKVRSSELFFVPVLEQCLSSWKLICWLFCSQMTRQALEELQTDMDKQTELLQAVMREQESMHEERAQHQQQQQESETASAPRTPTKEQQFSRRDAPTSPVKVDAATLSELIETSSAACSPVTFMPFSPPRASPLPQPVAQTDTERVVRQLRDENVALRFANEILVQQVCSSNIRLGWCRLTLGENRWLHCVVT